MGHMCRSEWEYHGRPGRQAQAVVLAILIAFLLGASTGCSALDIEARAASAWTATAASLPPTATPPPTPVPPTRTPRPTLAPSPVSSPRPAVATPVPQPGNPSVSAIFDRVSGLRGLSTASKVPMGFLGREELRDYLVRSLDRENGRQELEKSKAILMLLDLVEEDDDLYELYVSAMTEQIVGFYDFEAREMKLVGTGQNPGPMDELVLVHEYVHALQDASFNLGARIKAAKDDSEKALALQSLSEGDATLFMGLYGQSFMTPEQLMQLGQAQQPGGPSSGVLRNAPPVLEWQMLFPYLRGILFVAAGFQSGGVAAINQMYSNPPLTSEHIMHPAKYVAGEAPVVVDMPDLLPSLGQGWTVAESDFMGEFGFWSYLRGGLSEPAAESGASGWGGDRLVLLTDLTGRYALVISSSWDSSTEAQEFFQLLEQMWKTRRGSSLLPAGDKVLRWNERGRSGYAALKGASIQLVIAPDQGTADKLVSGLNR